MQARKVIQWVIEGAKRLIICDDCGEKKKHHANGKCDGCYSKRRMRRMKQPNPIF